MAGKALSDYRFVDEIARGHAQDAGYDWLSDEEFEDSLRDTFEEMEWYRSK